MWRLINEKVSARKDLEQDQDIIHGLGRAINASLKSDRQRRTEEAGGEIEALMEADPLHKRKPGAG